jgi:hypothetical protein
MNTPFQHFIDLASKVLEATNIEGGTINPYKGISYLSNKSVRFDNYPASCNVMFITHQFRQTSSVDISFTCPVDYDCDNYDDLFIEWTQNVEDFLSSDSMLLLDNQIKADLRIKAELIK